MCIRDSHVGAQSGRLRVDAATPVRLVYYTYNFPGWTLAVDGQPAAIETVAPYGLIGFDLPAGTHDVTLRMGGHYLPLGTIAWGMSLYFLVGNIQALGGHTGLGGIPPVSLFRAELKKVAKKSSNMLPQIMRAPRTKRQPSSLRVRLRTIPLDPDLTGA